MKAMFWVTVGLGAGVTAAVLTSRWIRKQRRAFAPSNLARQAGGRAKDLGSLLGDAAREFRAGMADREAEIRAGAGA
jgi:hypothetical protein